MELTNATLDGLGLRVFVMHLALTRRTHRPRHGTLGVLRLNHHLGRLFAQMFTKFQYRIFDLSQVGPGRLIRPLQQLVDRPFGFSQQFGP